MTQGHQNSRYSIGHCYVSVLHHFQEITTFTLYMTACGTEKTFSFNKTTEIAGHKASALSDSREIIT